MPRVSYIFIVETSCSLVERLLNTLWMGTFAAATRLALPAAVIPSICAPLCIFPTTSQVLRFL